MSDSKTEPTPKKKPQRGALAAVDRDETKARTKAIAALTTWLPLRAAQSALLGVAPDEDGAAVEAEKLLGSLRAIEAGTLP